MGRRGIAVGSVELDSYAVVLRRKRPGGCRLGAVFEPIGGCCPPPSCAAEDGRALVARELGAPGVAVARRLSIPGLGTFVGVRVLSSHVEGLPGVAVELSRAACEPSVAADARLALLRS